MLSYKRYFTHIAYNLILLPLHPSPTPDIEFFIAKITILEKAEKNRKSALQKIHFTVNNIHSKIKFDIIYEKNRII